MLVPIILIWVASTRVLSEQYETPEEQYEIPGGVTIENLLNSVGVVGHKNQAEFLEKLNPIDAYLFDILPTILHSSPSNTNGTLIEFKEYLWRDDSNDDAANLNIIELILRSGYQYESHDALADDGYITTLTRIINPLADSKYLRYPPILIEHGGTIDHTAYMIASSIQHHPEKWPRNREDGTITSWNRSLAFTLANNGFDVWLAESRGSSDLNNRRIKTKAVESVINGQNNGKNLSTGENVDMIFRGSDYWSFSLDDIIAHEFKSHIDTVMNITGAEKLHLFTFSLSTPSSLSFLSTRPDYARKIAGYVSMAPIISGEGLNDVITFTLRWICPMIPDSIGTLLVTDTLLSAPTRQLSLLINHNKWVRYSINKALITLIMGPSAKYRTLLDDNVMGHMLRRVSFKEAKQMCQFMRNNKLQKFDYGPIKNKLIYNSTEPPIYDLSNLQIEDWIVLAGANDALSTEGNRNHLLSMVKPKPSAVIIVPGFNHLDMIAGMENDKYVNLPLLSYFERKSSIPGRGSPRREYYRERSAEQVERVSDNNVEAIVAETGARALNLVSNIQRELKLVTDGASNLTGPVELISQMRNNMGQTLGKMMNVQSDKSSV